MYFPKNAWCLIKKYLIIKKKYYNKGLIYYYYLKYKRNNLYLTLF